jgi:hypothetical protein
MLSKDPHDPGERNMGIDKKSFIPIWVCIVLLVGACNYIVLPEGMEGSASTGSVGWTAIVTNVGTSDAGDLHIDLAIRNDTTDWSAMQAVEGKPAVLRFGDGQTTNCDTVFVSTGGHRLAPGFQMQGYTAGTKTEPVTQRLFVECSGAEAAPGSTLSIDYIYFTGQYNYYEQDANKADGTLELNLDEVVQDLEYPVASPVEDLVQPSDAQLNAINDCVLTLLDVARTDTGIQFTWQTTNPGEYNTYVHIGIPPVIGADGIIYGLYESPDIASVPITPPEGGTAEWTTEAAVPSDVTNLYILLSVETGKQRLFVNYAIDITDK